MAYHLRWRRAVIVSFFCHIFFFAGAGYLSAQLLATPLPPEQYVELELMNESQETARDSVITNRSIAPTPLSPSNPSLAKTEQPASTPTPSVSTSALSMVTTDASPLGNTSGSEEATGSSEATTPSSSSGPSSGSKGKSGGIIPPSILSKADPSYPQSARQGGLEGTVVLKVQILETGRAGNISISRSSGHEILDDAAIAALREWRFAPAKDRDSGLAISCYTTLPISFRLH
ncbi:energy transducer TonB [Pelosinus sp. UFO1]|uniref:energy transducer TonB n=1 Tax=Pelosinus sp. UFO1 TaxID=484770 RepID=UPI0004D16583|nr:energy transducer TonB [Pelosinus sp. UFO1]AIF49903.1 TonB family protein [Pelosinus sp. UFO1]